MYFCLQPPLQQQVFLSRICLEKKEFSKQRKWCLQVWLGKINSGLQPFTKIQFSWLPKSMSLFSNCFFRFLGFRIFGFSLEKKWLD